MLNTDPSLVTDGAKSAILRETTASIDQYIQIPINSKAGELGFASMALDAELGFTSGVVVESVSFDVYIDIANGYLPHWLLGLWDGSVNRPGFFSGLYSGTLAVHAPSWDTGPQNLELKMAVDASGTQWTGFGIDVVDGEWNLGCNT